MAKLPKVLAREPLVDAIFEVRLGGDPQMADILPGILFEKLDPKPKLQRLPPAEIPKPIRAQDPNLVFAPLVRLDLADFGISFGDRNMVIACKLPYPKWPRFREFIDKIVQLVASVGLSGHVERYSLKYVNLIEASDVADQIAKIDMHIRIGEVDVDADHVSLRVQKLENAILHIISVQTGAQARLENGKELNGVLVDVDSILTVDNQDFSTFSKGLASEIENLREENKVKFFSSLTEETIKEMGPEYD